MKHHLQGNSGVVDLALEPITTVTVAPRTVATILATPAGQEISFAITIGEGAGVHLIFSELPQQGDIKVEVAAGAQFTLSLIGTLQSKHGISSLRRLVGDGANAHVQLSAAGAGESEAEFTCTVEHAARATFARMVVRRV